MIAFIFADLIVLPIVAIYRKYYGGAFAARVVTLMFVTMVAAALVIDGIFSAAGLVPSVHTKRSDVFQPVAVDYKLVLNLLGLVLFVAFFALTVRRGRTDPVCGMTVDRAEGTHIGQRRRDLLLLRRRLPAKLRERCSRARSLT